MYRSRLLVVLSLPALLFVSNSSAQVSAQDLPAGRGKAELTRVCAQCHALDIVVKKSNTADGWGAVVDEMAAKGAQATDDEFDLIIKYLAAHFGPKVNVNKAADKELAMRLGISAADAQSIVHYRESSGAFKDWSDLQKVPGIDLKKLEAQKNLLDFSAN